MLRTIAPGIWEMTTNLSIGAGARLPCRATLVRLEDGSLAIHSPLAVDDEDARSIAELGEVRWLVAPNRLHWMFVEAARTRWPGARVLGAPGLERKLGGRVRFEHLAADGTLPGTPEVRVLRIQGAPGMDEHVLFHEPSRSLLVADLMFNVQDAPFLTRAVLRMMGTWRATAQSRVWRFAVKDRAAAAESASRLLSFDFQRLIVAHGEVVEDARPATERALAWMRGGRPLALAPARG